MEGLHYQGRALYHHRREFNFKDVYRLDKERENKAALEVLPDLLMELDAMDSRKRLLALVEGVLAANIFDWGSKACEQLYRWADKRFDW